MSKRAEYDRTCTVWNGPYFDAPTSVIAVGVPCRLVEQTVFEWQDNQFSKADKWLTLDQEYPGPDFPSSVGEFLFWQPGAAVYFVMDDAPFELLYVYGVEKAALGPGEQYFRYRVGTYPPLPY